MATQAWIFAQEQKVTEALLLMRGIREEAAFEAKTEGSRFVYQANEDAWNDLHCALVELARSADFTATELGNRMRPHEAAREPHKLTA
jgi:hypothetical protein